MIRYWLKIMNIGICGSDIHVYHGKHPFTSYPVTQGHEVSGEVVKLGKDVTVFHEGQKVTIEPQVYCGECYPCRHGKYNLCEELKVMGFQTTEEQHCREKNVVNAGCVRENGMKSGAQHQISSRISRAHPAPAVPPSFPRPPHRSVCPPAR